MSLKANSIFYFDSGFVDQSLVIDLGHGLSSKADW